MNNKTGWQTEEAARRYLSVSDSMIPGRADVYNIVAELATVFLPVSGRFLDLGCGYGHVTEAVLKKSPEASADLIDFSDEMIRGSEERFRGNQKIKLTKYDLNQGIPDSFDPAAFDAVVSCFALHHIEFDRRIPLYNRIFQVLKPGGVLIIGDRLIEESPIINDWMFKMWVKWMTGRVKDRFGVLRTFAQIRDGQLAIDRDLGDKPGSLWDMERDLKSAGYSCVDCLYKNLVIAVIAAIKP